MTTKQGTYLQSVRRAYPGLDIMSVEFNDKGQNSDVLILNEELVFRFPKYPHVLDGLRTETAILIGIQEYVSLPIPAPEFIHLEGQPVGEAFMGYRCLPGEPLWREIFRAIQNEETLDALAAQLAGFLKELHAVPVEEAIDCELVLFDTYEEWAGTYARIQGKLFVFMRPDARDQVAQHFESYLSESVDSRFRPVLKHSDFGPSNLLFDPQAQAISGIIDFGSASLGDPAYDFAGLLSGYGESFVQRCSRTYPEVESFLHRSRFYLGTFALLEALFGIENDDPRAFEAGMERYVDRAS